MSGVATGLAAGLLSALAYGSFAVPIKSRAVLEAKVHPLIFQSYKSLMCFATAWLVLLWTDLRFTWWATLAAFIWVMDGIVAIISIHLAGLGTAQTMWSCVSVFVSFAWGKLYFHEPMANVPLTVTGLTLMLAGMAGLGWIAGQAVPDGLAVLPSKEVSVIKRGKLQVTGTQFPCSQDREEDKSDPSEIAFGDASDPVGDAQGGCMEGDRLLLSEQSVQPVSDSASPITMHPDRGEREPLSKVGISGREEVGIQRAEQAEVDLIEKLRHRRRYALGVLGSVYVGICAGSMMICLKFAPPDLTEDQYTLSFGIGVGLVTLTALGTYFGGCLLFAMEPPAFQVEVAAAPACLAGILWSIGNYLSIVAVAHLGMAIGWPLVQCSLIVSNMWALIWYREIQGRPAIMVFVCSALVIIIGVFLLAFYGL